MATMSFEGLAARAWGLPGREISRGARVVSDGLCMWRVLSQEADMTRALGWVC